MNKFFGLLLLYFVGLSNDAKSQDLTNEGTDFWIGFTEVFEEAKATFEINITSRIKTNGTIRVGDGSEFTTSFNVEPGIVTTVYIPSALAHNPLSEITVKRAIHVESIDPVSVFASTYGFTSHSEATVCLPSPALGSHYLVSSYPNRAFYERGIAQSEFVIVCGSLPARIVIIPSCPTDAGNKTGERMIIDLRPGDFYQVKAAKDSIFDLTGTVVRAANGTDQFAVFCGHKMAPIVTSSDHKDSACPIYELAYPTRSWGYEHILVRSASQRTNEYRVLSLSDNCEIFENGVLKDTINAGETYSSFFKPDCAFIRTTKKAQVSQFMVSHTSSGKGTGDPSMVMINPNEQMYLDSVSFYIGFYNGISNHYVSVITRSSDTSTLKLDNVLLTGFKALSSNPAYSFKIARIRVGSHSLTTTGSGFLAYPHGDIYGESYFYSAGAMVNMVKDTTQKLPSTVIFPFSNDEHENFAAQLATDYQQSTYEIAENLIHNPDLVISVNGYTSTPGDTLYNLQLGESRAATVRDIVITRLKAICLEYGKIYDFNENRITVKSFGEAYEFLVEKNDDDVNDDLLSREAKQAKNRRVEVEYRTER